MKSRLVMMPFLLAICACVSVQSFRSGSGKTYAPTRPDDVLVFYAEADVKRPFEVIAEITTSGSTGWDKDQGDLIAKAREEAAGLGANGLLIKEVDNGGGGENVMAVLFGTNDKKQRAQAIRFLPEASPAPNR